jgi:hypothetical protein
MRDTNAYKMLYRLKNVEKEPEFENYIEEEFESIV